MAQPDVKEERNLSVIQRLDKDVLRVIGYASHVVIYIFNEEEKSWDREDVEGTLFIVLRCSQPKYRVMVINRLNPTNLVAPIDEDFEFEERDPFLIFKNASAIRGVWFSKAEERPRIAKVFESLPDNASEGEVERAGNTPIPQQQSHINAKQQQQPSAPPMQQQPTPHQNQPQQQMPMMGMMHQGYAAPVMAQSPTHGGVRPFYPPVPMHQFQQMSMSPRPHPAMGFHPGPRPYGSQSVASQHQAQSTTSASLGGSGSGSGRSGEQDPLVLSKQQLQEVLLKLIKNDRFIDLLHSEYLKTQDKRKRSKEPPREP